MSATAGVAAELAAHARALRVLAADLVGRGDADDLVQDTAVRALHSPPPVASGLFAWLATVMRNLAANRARGDRRRRDREAAHGESGEGPPADADAAHRDSVRAVTDALWSLPEPYQTTLVQRYFGERSPAWIAKTTATPLATVKSRLQRGLELLRAALRQRDGRDWRLALLPVFGLPAVPVWLVALLSVTSMSTFAKSTAAVAAAALAAFAFWNWSPAPLPAAPPAIAAAGADPAGLAADSRGEEAPTAAREVVAAATPAPAPDLAQPFEFTLRCRVVDADGLPLRDAQVAVAPPGCALAVWPEGADEDGGIVLRWRGRVPAMTMALGLLHASTNTALQRVTVEAGIGTRVSFVAGVAPLPASVRLDERGVQVVVMPECSQGRTDCRACHGEIKGPDVFVPRGTVRSGLHREAVFGDRLVVASDGCFAFANLPPAPGRLLLWGVKGERLPIAEEPTVAGNGGDVVFDLRERGGSDGSLRLFVRTHDGQSPDEPDVRVWQVQTGRGAFLQRREDGAFHAHGLIAGFYRLDVGAVASGFQDLGQHWVDGKGLADLGTVTLVRPARLQLDGDLPAAGCELWACNGLIDLRADDIQGGGRELLLPAGRWLALWRRDGVVAAREFDLATNAMTTLRLDR